MNDINWKKEATLVLENCEEIDVNLDISKLNIAKTVWSDEAMKQCPQKFNSIFSLEDSEFRINKAELQGLSWDDTKTNEERLKDWNDITQIYFKDEKVRKDLLGDSNRTLFMLWESDDDYSNSSYSLTEDDNYLYIKVNCKEDDCKEKKYVDRIEHINILN